ncbi:MAG: hypothetical protein KGS61_12230, partial [Verrucomicrobia bacterium]|nr:hypothetical protein [Verrucomicrobiota bacterium]
YQPTNEMRATKFCQRLLGLTCGVVFLVGIPAVMADPSCCVKAAAKGKECAHKCCIEAHKQGKLCPKCQTEPTCCDKAIAAGKPCAHKCCIEARKAGKVCEKCNPTKKSGSIP